MVVPACPGEHRRRAVVERHRDRARGEVTRADTAVGEHHGQLVRRRAGRQPRPVDRQRHRDFAKGGLLHLAARRPRRRRCRSARVPGRRGRSPSSAGEGAGRHHQVRQAVADGAAHRGRCERPGRRSRTARVEVLRPPPEPAAQQLAAAQARPHSRRPRRVATPTSAIAAHEAQAMRTLTARSAAGGGGGAAAASAPASAAGGECGVAEELLPHSATRAAPLDSAGFRVAPRPGAAPIWWTGAAASRLSPIASWSPERSSRRSMRSPVATAAGARAEIRCLPAAVDRPHLEVLTRHRRVVEVTVQWRAPDGATGAHAPSARSPSQLHGAKRAAARRCRRAHASNRVIAWHGRAALAFSLSPLPRARRPAPAPAMRPGTARPRSAPGEPGVGVDARPRTSSAPSRRPPSRGGARS